VSAKIGSSFDMPSAPNVRDPASVILSSNRLTLSLMALENFAFGWQVYSYSSLIPRRSCWCSY